jgi:hypothetical protein
MKSVRNFTAELFRRKVVRLVGAYVAVFWLLATGFASLFPTLGFPDWALPAFMVTGLAAIPVLALFSWKYDVIPPQLVRDPKDIELSNPGLSRAVLRHDNRNAGYVLLAWRTEEGAAREQRFFRPVAIGREPSNDIELADPRVSRHHAVIWAESGAWLVRDLDSANGTFIDHRRVDGTALLPRSCEVQFHPHGPTVAVTVMKTRETLISP